METNQIDDLKQLIELTNLPYGDDVQDDDLDKIYFKITEASQKLSQKSLSDFTDEDYFLLVLVLGIANTSIFSVLIDSIIKNEGFDQKVQFAQNLTGTIRDKTLTEQDAVSKVILNSWPRCIWLLKNYTFDDIVDIDNEGAINSLHELRTEIDKKLDTRLSAISREVLRESQYI